jgi:hypothetical protein
METVVALDGRSAEGSYEALRAEAHRVFVFDTTDEWPEGQLNRVLDEATREWAFLVSDDEMPSEPLWKFATRVPDVRDDRGRHYLWRPRMLAPIPGTGRFYRPLDTHQPRYFPREAIRWPGNFDVLPTSRLDEIDFELVLWHYTLFSPRAYRENKVRIHEAAWMREWASHPWPPSSRKAYLYEDFPEEHQECVSS